MAVSLQKEIRKVDPAIQFSIVKYLPSALDMEQSDRAFDHVYVLPGAGHPYKYFQTLALRKKSNNLFQFKKGDVLIVFTEYELHNHYLVLKAKAAGAKVFLFDEGIGSFQLYNYTDFKHGMSRSALLTNYLMKYLGYPHSSLCRGSNNFFWKLNEQYYDGFVSQYKFPTRLNTKKYFIKPLLSYGGSIDALNDDGLFILGGHFDWFLPQPEYLLYLERLCKVANNKFKDVYFKFHHAELTMHPPEVLSKQMEILQNYDIKILDNVKLPAEIIIEKIKTKYVVAPWSSALLSLFMRGCEPIFTFKALNIQTNDTAIMEELLRSVGYKLLLSLEELCPSFKTCLRKENIFEQHYSIGDLYRDVLRP